MPNKTPSNDELVIHPALDGLAALMKTVEAAMATGRGRLEAGCGVTVISGGPASFAGVTLTFSDRGGGLALAA